MKITLKRSQEFQDWLDNIADVQTHVRINARIRNAELGNFGDHASVGSGVFEMRLHFGSGYRIYYFRSRDVIYYLLIGGDKSSQKRDIARAIELKRAIEEEDI